jgi:hypothetical protein
MRGKDTALLRTTALTNGLASDALTDWGSTSAGIVTSACRETAAAAALASLAAAVAASSSSWAAAPLLSVTTLLLLAVLLLPGMLSPGVVGNATLSPAGALATEIAVTPAGGTGAAAGDTREAART